MLMSKAIDAAASTNKIASKNVHVHHLIPLEHAHRMGKGFDPNTLSNLAAVDKKIHSQITSEWNRWSRSAKDLSPEAIMKQVAKIEEQFGKHFFR
jgi:hypothetical protein